MTTRAILDGIGAIVFDAVGTLMHPSPSVADVYVAAALRQGIRLDRDVRIERKPCCTGICGREDAEDEIEAFL